MNEIHVQYYPTKIGKLGGYGGGFAVKQRLLNLERKATLDKTFKNSGQ